MANKMTRKGLAVVAASAMGLAGLTASPAYATDALVIGLNTGTSFNSVTGYANEITLSTSIASAYSAVDGDLSYRITNAGEANVDLKAGTTLGSEVRADNTDGKLTEYDKQTALADSDTAGGATGLQFDEKDVVLDLSVGTFSGGVGNYASENYLTVAVGDETTTNFTISVQPWLDTNSNQKMDPTEPVGNTVTITFYDETNVSAVSTVSAPVLGASTVEVVTTTTPELNGEQLGSNFINTKVTAQGNANAVFTSTTLSSTGTAGVTSYSGTTKQWTSTVQLAFAAPATPWGGSAVTPETGLDLADYSYDHTTTTVTATTDAAHSIPVGGLFQIAGVTNVSGGSNDESDLIGKYVALAGTTGSTLVFSKALTATVAVGSEITFNTVAGDEVTEIGIAATQATVAAGTYSADAYIGTTTKLASATAAGVAAASASDIKGAIAGAADYTGGKNETGSATAISVRKGFKGTIPVTATVFKSTGAVAPNVNVQVTASGITGTMYINDVKLTNGKVVTLTADANGAVAFNVSSTTAAASDAVSITISSEGLTGNDDSQFTLTWSNATYALYDLKDVNSTTSNIITSRTVDKGGSYTFNLALVDQWGQYLTSNLYRYEVVTAGNTAGTTTHVIDADGVTEVTVTDQQLVGGGGSITVDIDVEKFASGAWGADDLTATSGEYEEWASGSGRHTINVITAQTEAVALNTSGSNTLGGSNGDFDGNIVTSALVSVDNRLSIADFTTGGTTNVSGIVRNATTLAAVAGTEVSISGPADYFFKVGDKIAQGSLTFISKANGTFDVVVYSNKVMADQVVTVSSNGSSKEVKVKFTGGVTARSGTQVSISAPDFVLPGSTLSFTAKVLDKFGNAVDSDQDASNAAGTSTVDATDATYKIAYSGPGLIVGTAPADVKESSVDGNKFNILLGSNDSGTITITVSYDANGDKDFTDVGDLVETKTITIGAAPAPVADTKVNAGSFKGYVAVYAKGYEGKRLSAKIGNDWVIVDSLASNFERVTDFTGAGVSIAVRIYIDRVLIDTINLVTK